VETLRAIVGRLPADLPAAICIVLHLAPDSPSALAAILQRAGRLPCSTAKDGDQLLPGHILVAPPNHHLVIEDRRVRLTVGPRENNHRPAVDTLFRSAAEQRGAAVIGVVLSGNRDDGTAGLSVIKACGGVAVVQDPDSALYPGMPASAIAHVAVDAVVAVERIASTIVAMVSGDAPPPPPARDDPGRGPERSPDPRIQVCPECGGVLTEHEEAGTVLWSCRVGHRYSVETLVDAQASDVEAALWTAVRALEDRALLLRRLSEQQSRRHQPRSAGRFRGRAEDAEAQAQLIRNTIAAAGPTSLAPVAGDDDSGGETEVA
jgi:two-component system chemotaxis response regulator CheB